MDRITLSGIQAFGYHGVLDHERAYGQRFLVDLHLDVDLSIAAVSDRLDDTIDYGELTGAVADLIAGEPVQLIEALAGRIADRALEDPRVAAVEVTVHKPAAPVPAVAQDVAVTLRRARDGGPR